MICDYYKYAGIVQSYLDGGKSHIGIIIFNDGNSINIVWDDGVMSCWQNSILTSLCENSYFMLSIVDKHQQ